MKRLSLVICLASFIVGCGNKNHNGDHDSEEEPSHSATKPAVNKPKKQLSVLKPETLLPALLATTRIITLWELLYVKLGRDPQQTIPLFDGLRPLQAKIVTLMGEFRNFRKGEHLFRQGEIGREMFVLIGGRAEAKINVGTESKSLRTMKRGDVIGEMALIRHNVRTADVVAVDDVPEEVALET